MTDTLKYAVNCTTSGQRTEFAYRAQELLRLEHNIVGKWYREGITQAKYDQLPQPVKDAFPYSDKLLPEVDLRKYQNEIFESKSAIIIQGILESRQLMKDSTVWDLSIDLDNLSEIK